MKIVSEENRSCYADFRMFVRARVCVCVCVYLGGWVIYNMSMNKAGFSGVSLCDSEL